MMLLQTTSAASSSSSSSDGGGSEASSSSDDGITAVARDILARLPPLFDVPSALAKCFPAIYRPSVFIVMRVCRYPVCYEDSMNSVLTQELVRFNALLHVMGNSLRNLLLALKGSVLMSADLDDVATSLRSRLRACCRFHVSFLLLFVPHPCCAHLLTILPALCRGFGCRVPTPAPSPLRPTLPTSSNACACFSPGSTMARPSSSGCLVFSSRSLSSLPCFKISRANTNLRWIR